MELVHGVPITKYCDDNLTPTAFTSLAKGFDVECLCCRRRFSVLIHRTMKPTQAGLTFSGVAELNTLTT
jgi:hypothetical protein